MLNNNEMKLKRTIYNASHYARFFLKGLVSYAVIMQCGIGLGLTI